jgi:hypothetical protein
MKTSRHKKDIGHDCAWGTMFPYRDPTIFTQGTFSFIEIYVTSWERDPCDEVSNWEHEFHHDITYLSCQWSFPSKNKRERTIWILAGTNTWENYNLRKSFCFFCDLWSLCTFFIRERPVKWFTNSFEQEQWSWHMLHAQNVHVILMWNLCAQDYIIRENVHLMGASTLCSWRTCSPSEKIQENKQSPVAKLREGPSYPLEGNWKVKVDVTCDIIREEEVHCCCR